MRLEWNEEERNYCAGLVGIPYEDTGDTRAGCYCVGLLCIFYRDHGMELPNPASYDPNKVVREFIAPFFAKTDDKPRYGDVVKLMDSTGGSNHLGIWTPEGIFHANPVVGVIRTRHGRRPVFGIYRHKDALA